MRDDWTETTLGELTASTRPICYGVLKPGPYVEGGIPLVRITDMDCSLLGPQGMHLISPELDNEFRRSRLSGNEVLLSIQGTVGRVARCAPELAGANISRTIAVIDCDERLLNELLALFLESLAVNKAFNSSGSTRDSLNISEIRLIKVPLPPIAEQQRIVDVVASVDTYIDALQQQVDAARAAFTSLCMSTFSSSEHTQKLCEVAKVIMGQSPEGATCNSEGIGTPLLTGPTEFTNRIVGPPRQWTSKETKISEDGDILFCVRGATAGRINLGTYRAVIGRGLASIRCVLESDTNLVRYALGVGMSQLLPAAGGTIFPNVSQSQLRDFKLWWPPEIERKRISNILTSIEDVIQATERAVVEAKNLRSGLLSDLLSGEHEIPVSYDELLGAA
jgi:type I restriction enzyme S subunit